MKLPVAEVDNTESEQYRSSILPMGKAEAAGWAAGRLAGRLAGQFRSSKICCAGSSPRNPRVGKHELFHAEFCRLEIPGPDVQ